MKPIDLTDWRTDPTGHWPTLARETILGSMGHIPSFLQRHDLSAAEQFDMFYGFAGGWQPLAGWFMNDDGVILYGFVAGGSQRERDFMNSSPLYPAAQLVKQDGEIVRFYPGAWVSICQPNGDYEVAKID